MQKGKTLPPMSVMDMNLNYLMVRLHPRALGNVKYLFIAIILRSILTQSGSTCWGAYLCQIELLDHLTMCKQITDV